MTRTRRNHVRVYLTDATLARLRQESARTKVPITSIIETALERNAISVSEYMTHAAAKYAYLAASLSLQQAALTFDPDDFKRRLDAISSAFSGVFGPSPNIPPDIQKRTEKSLDPFVLDFAKVLLAHVDPADTGTIL